MKKQKITSMAIVLVLMISTFAALTPRASSQRTWSGVVERSLAYGVEPYEVHDLTAAELDALPDDDPVPFNIDMVNAESSYTSNDGTGIYVAVLDTGLLTNWQTYFPPGKVSIDWLHAKGFTHDVYYDSTLGEVVFGPLLDNRGPFTHDTFAFPTPIKDYDNVIYPLNLGGWGSGHGTHVTSIITGYNFTRPGYPIDYKWISGVAGKVTIIPVLVLDEWLYIAPNATNPSEDLLYFDRGGTDEMVAAGIRYIGDLARDLHIKIIINMSLGGPGYTQEELDAINYAISQGVIIVASAGNSGYAGMGWPGAFPEVISAAAAGWTQEYGGGVYSYYWWWNDVPEKLNTKNTVINWTHPAWEGYDIYGDPTTDPYWNPAYEGPTGSFKNNWQTYLCDFSSRPNSSLGQSNKDLDVSAPGAAIRGPYKSYGYGTSRGYSAVWGTSQAAPHVSGIAALILQSYPNLDQASIERILKKAATRTPMPSDGAYVSDVFSYWFTPFACYHYKWYGTDAGAGFLTVNEALKTAVLNR